VLRAALARLGQYLVAVAGGESLRSPRTSVRPKQGFEHQVRGLVERRKNGAGRLPVGSVRLLGLDEIRQTAGSSWHAIAGTARVIAKQVIGAHLTTDDLFE
jgi:hypothetical protein